MVLCMLEPEEMRGGGGRGHQLALEQHVSVMLPSLTRLRTSH